jgi:hypothetical protein
MKNIIFLSIYLLTSCNQKFTNSHESIKKKVQGLGEPSCSMINEFSGYSKIYIDANECGCGPNAGFFGTYWNITCDIEEDKQKIKHVNFVGDMKKWELLINFLKSRQESESKELLRLTTLILSSSKDNTKPFTYYDNIKTANEYLINLKSESFRKAFTEFYNNSFKN